MGQVAGCSSVELDCRSSQVRQGETSLGNLFADAVKMVHHTDVVLLNTGCMRGGVVFPAGSLRRRDVFAWNPFRSTIVKIYASGREIQDYIEQELECYQHVCGNFPAIAGLNYSFDPSASPGHRLKGLLHPDGAPVSDTHNFTVALTDYQLATSRLKHNALYNMVTLNDAVPLVEVVLISAGCAAVPFAIWVHGNLSQLKLVSRSPSRFKSRNPPFPMQGCHHGALRGLIFPARLSF
ncbi:unnamed protein product [Polarella glacialis]|uniref:5'-Nucleotidase C-terminal domain-containing protein n=1 Tax=Polarella glacialis TaxID=89957 RepID=A0A813FNP6_POLGL|nr:unnamed protein product [Polarella glacialis]